MRLVRPSLEVFDAFVDYANEWKMHGERINPRILESFDKDFNQFLQQIEDIESIKVTEKQVPQSIYFLIDNAGYIIGSASIRLKLNKRYLNSEGHIGAGIRPTERKKGHATILLKLALHIMREKGFEKALVTCNWDNVGSEKAILKNGGIRDQDYIEAHGNIVKRYWIPLNEVEGTFVTDNNTFDYS